MGCELSRVTLFDAYYSYDEASEAAGVSKSTLHRQVAKGKLRTVRIGKLVRFVGSDLLAYQRERGGAEVRVLGGLSSFRCRTTDIACPGQSRQGSRRRGRWFEAGPRYKYLEITST